MSNQIHIIQNAITTTISEIFRGDFRRICEVKKAVLHLEAIYFCHGTCYLLKRENMPIKDQLALYQRIELIPQSTTEFFENNRECIINNWPEESALAAKPEILYDALLRIVSCRRVVSVDTIRRQFLLGRKDLQFLKAMVQSRHLGMGVGFCLGRGKPPDPCF